MIGEIISKDPKIQILKKVLLPDLDLILMDLDQNFDIIRSVKDRELLDLDHFFDQI